MKENEKKRQEIGEKIIRSVQKHLSTRYPYLIMIIYNLIPLYDPMEKKMSTDGKYLFYSPSFLIKVYKDKKRRVQLEKMYMHIIVHCIFGHVTGRDKKETKAYDAMVDLSASIAMGELKERGIRTPKQFIMSKEVKQIQQVWENKLGKEMFQEMISNKNIRELVESLSDYTIQDNHTYWNQINPVVKEIEQKNSKAGGEWQDLTYHKRIGERWGQLCNMLLSQNMLKNKKLAALLAGKVFDKKQMVYGMAEESRCSYKEFLRKFVENQEVMKIDEDSFDYIWYHIGTEWYGNMPILEPLEYKDDKVCDNFVIALDTSGSCSGEIMKRFLRETWNVFRDMSTQNRIFNIYLMQCDDKITYEKKLKSDSDIPDFNNMTLYGFGGTDFRPVFERIEELRECGELTKINGLIYFSDGFGSFPETCMDYETVFVLPFDIDEKMMYYVENEERIPSWITKIWLKEDELEIE